MSTKGVLLRTSALMFVCHEFRLSKSEVIDTEQMTTKKDPIRW